MKIVGVQVLEVVRRLDGRSWNPSFRWHERRAPLLVIDTDAGIRGIGEAWSRQPEIALVLDHLALCCAPGLLGRDAGERDALLAEMRDAAPSTVPWVAPASASAVDIALWDIAARANGQPLWRELGGGTGRAAVYASGGLYRDGATEDDLAREFAAYAVGGFRAAKMKIGALSRDDDLRRVRSVRHALGDGTVLWVDAVNQLSADSAPGWCDALKRESVAAIQAPIPFTDIAGMARINAMLPVVATEAEYREDVYRALLDAAAVTHVQYCLGLCGGFSGAMRIDALPSARGLRSTPQCFSTAVLQAASLHLAAARPNVVAAEYHRFHDHLAFAMPAAMRRVEAGAVCLDDTPGLGVAAPEPGPQPDGSDVRVHHSANLHDQASQV